jgi:hypothetical protein
MIDRPPPDGPLSEPVSARTGWAHFQRELIILSWSIMEVALITPLAFFLLPAARFWPPILMGLLLLLVMQLSFNLSRTMSLLWIKRDVQRNVMVLVLIPLALIALRGLLYNVPSLGRTIWLADFYENFGSALWTRDLALFLLLVFMWWRGIRLSQQNFGISRAGLRLRLGGLLLAPLAIWSSVRAEWNVTPFVLLFFLSSVAAVAQSRAEQNERDVTGKVVLLAPSWMAIIFGVALLIVSVAGILAAFVKGDSALLIVAGLSPVRSAINVGGAAAISVIVYVSAPLFAFLEIILSWLSAFFTRLLSRVVTEPIFLDLPESPISEVTSEAVERSEPFIDGGRIIAALFMIAVVLVVVLALGRLYRPMGTLDRRSVDGLRPIQDLEGGPSLRDRVLGRLGLIRNWRAAASIRRIYREMGNAAAASGYPRSEAETPFEYLATLDRVWPDNASDAQRITQAYVKVRYGELPETKQELKDIAEAWLRLQRTQPTALEQQMTTVERT